MMSIGNGDLQGWILAQSLMTVVLAIMLIGCIRIAYRSATSDRYSWRASRTFKVIVACIPLLIGLTIWYRIDSHDMWVAHSDMHDGIDYFTQAEAAPTITDIRADHIPTYWWPTRPQRTPACQTHPVYGRAFIAVDPEQEDVERHFNQIIELLEADGWETFLRSEDDTGVVVLTAYGDDDKSFLFQRSGDRGPGQPVRYLIDANRICRDEEPLASD